MGMTYIPPTAKQLEPGFYDVVGHTDPAPDSTIFTLKIVSEVDPTWSTTLYFDYTQKPWGLFCDLCACPRDSTPFDLVGARVPLFMFKHQSGSLFAPVDSRDMVYMILGL